MQNKSNSIFSEVTKFLAENNFTKEGIKVGQTYRVKIKNVIQDVKVVKIDLNMVIYQRNHVPGTMAYQLQRMPIEDFEDSIVSK